MLSGAFLLKNKEKEMMQERRMDGEWVSIRSSQTCPVCGSRRGRCSMLIDPMDQHIIFYKCKYKENNRERSGWYIHLPHEVDGIAVQSHTPKYINLADFKQTSITKEDIALWDAVYREMRKIFFSLTGSFLYPEHKENLLERGFSIEEIERIGFFSVPRNEKIIFNGYKCSIRTAIITELEKKFNPNSLLKVPGFLKCNKNGSDFVIFKNSIFNNETKKFEDLDAYFIPYIDEERKIAGLQFRLNTLLKDASGKSMRYLWYSSKNISCGSPIDYFTPKELSDDNVILITEGAIKAKYAASRLKIRALAEAGVGNYRRLIYVLQKIEELENKRYRILLALDMDKYTNKDVINAEIKTISILLSLGYSVTLLEWNVLEGKGIDDKIKNFGIKDFRYISI